MFQQVVVLDPDFDGGYAGAAWTLSFDAMWSHEDAGAGVGRAMALAQQAIKVDETFAWSHTALGFAFLNKLQHDKAMAASAQAIALQPNDADAHAHHGLILGISGQHAQGIAAVERAIPLNPQFVYEPYLNIMAQIKLMAGDYQGSITAFEENVSRQGPIGPPALCWPAAAYWALGQKDDAARMSAMLSEKFPEFRLKGWNFHKLIREPGVRDRLQDLMLAAGVAA